MPCMYWVRVFCEDSPGAFAHQPLVKYPGRWVDLVDIGLSFLHGCRGVAGAGSGIGRGPGSLTLGRFSHALSPQLVGADRMGGLGVGLSPEARFPGDKLSIQGLKVCPSGADPRVTLARDEWGHSSPPCSLGWGLGTSLQWGGCWPGAAPAAWAWLGFSCTGNGEGDEACSPGYSAPEGPQGHVLHRPSPDYEATHSFSSFSGLAKVIHGSLISTYLCISEK